MRGPALSLIAAILSVSSLSLGSVHAEEVPLTFFEDLPVGSRAGGVPNPGGLAALVEAALNPGTYTSVCAVTEVSSAACPRPEGTSESSPRCGGFLSEDCTPGNYGRFIKSLFHSKAGFKLAGRETPVSYGHFIDRPPSDISTYCKKYNSFKREERETFWVWVLMQLSEKEFQCGDAKKKAAHAGHFQLEESNSLRQYRPDACWDSTIKADIKSGSLKLDKNTKNSNGTPKKMIENAQPNIRCALAGLAQQMMPINDPKKGVINSGRLFTLRPMPPGKAQSQWGPLRSTEVRNRIKGFRSCGN